MDLSDSRPAPRDPAAHLRLVLWRADKAVETAEIEHLRSLGLCMSDFAILEVLLHKGPLPVNVIGQKVLLTSGSITTAVTRLETRGLVSKQPGTRDRRVTEVHLTPEGETFAREQYARHLECLQAITRVLSAEEQGTLVTLLKKLGLHAASRETDR